MRIFNTYGPRLRPADGRVVSNFLVQAIDGEPLTIYGDGTQTRSFCFVDDEVRGHPRAVRLRHRRPGEHRQPDEFTMLELAELVLEVTGVELRARVRAAARSTTRRSAGPTSRCAERVLGWEPKVELREGLARTHDWYLEERAVVTRDDDAAEATASSR